MYQRESTVDSDLSRRSKGVSENYGIQVTLESSPTVGRIDVHWRAMCTDVYWRGTCLDVYWRSTPDPKELRITGQRFPLVGTSPSLPSLLLSPLDHPRILDTNLRYVSPFQCNVLLYYLSSVSTERNLLF